jgi:hypothetical protein
MKHLTPCALAFCVALLVACGSARPIGVTNAMPTTGGRCVFDGSACRSNAECCSDTCFAGECERVEP